MISAAWTEHWEQIVPFLAFSPGRPTRRLHDQHDRGAQPPDPQDHQDPRQLLVRGLRTQALYLAITRAQRTWRHTQGELFAYWRHHAFITNRTEPMHLLDSEHRQHAVVKLVIRDLKRHALAHFPL